VIADTADVDAFIFVTPGIEIEVGIKYHPGGSGWIALQFLIQA
jgi:hypothetical protein